MESSVSESWNPGRKSAIHSAPRRIQNWNLVEPCQISRWNPAMSAMCKESTMTESWNPVRQLFYYATLIN
jgi:hypothetical protein